jgi:hypothetical protein
MDLGQHIILGVLSFGVPLALFDLTDRWLRWKLYRDGPFVGSVDDWVGAIAVALLAGMLFGFASTSTEPQCESGEIDTETRFSRKKLDTTARDISSKTNTEP